MNPFPPAPRPPFPRRKVAGTFPGKVPATFVVGAVLALSAACASSGAVPRPFPAPDGPSTPASGKVAGTFPGKVPATFYGAGGYAVAGTGLGLQGVPYRNGGADPSGFDCSGFIWYVFAQHGVEVPRTVTDLYAAGQAVSADALEPGDLVFFSTVAPGATHVGLSIGGDQFVHAPSSQGEVRVERFTAPYWRTRFVGARRVL